MWHFPSSQFRMDPDYISWIHSVVVVLAYFWHIYGVGSGASQLCPVRDGSLYIVEIYNSFRPIHLVLEALCVEKNSMLLVVYSEFISCCIENTNEGIVFFLIKKNSERTKKMST